MSFKVQAVGTPRIVSAGLPPETCELLAKMLPDVAWESAASLEEVLERAACADARLLVLDDSLLGKDHESGLQALQQARVPPIFYVLDAELLRHGDLPRRLMRLGVSRLFHRPLRAQDMARQIAFQLGVSLKNAAPSQTQVEVETITALAKLWQRFRAANLERVRVIARAGQAAEEGTLDMAMIEWARREAHKLIGSSGTYGFPTASLLAREAEGLLEQKEVNGLRLVELSLRIERELEGTPGGNVVASPSRAMPSLSLITKDERLAEEVAWAAPRFNLNCQVTAGPAASGPSHPDAIVVDVSQARTLEERVGIHRELCHRHPGVPLVVLTSDDGLEARLAATELGGHRVLSKSGSLHGGMMTRSDVAHLTSKILEEVKSLLESRRRQVFRILAVDDDPSALAGVEVVLRPLGCKVTGLCDPLEFWHLLEVTSPDLVMLDVDMPGISGIDLCRALRTDRRWSECPVLFLTSYIDSATILELFDAGADDYVSKPIVAPELSARVRNRLTRSQFRDRPSDSESLNERRRVRLEAEHWLREAERRLQTLALARVALEIPDGAPYAEILRDFPLRCRRLLGDQPVVALWGAAEFLLIAPDRSKGDALRALAQVQAELSRQYRVGMRAGASEYPQDGTSFEAVLNAAEAALHEARTEQRLRLVAWSPTQAPPDSPDVLLIDDDSTMSDMLQQTCEARGYRMICMEDGQVALDALSHDRVKPRVILLDEDLPGLRGLEVMRNLVASGRLDAVGAPKVILLSGKLEEEQVAWALAHGAFDFLSKPVYLSALMRRLELALGS